MPETPARRTGGDPFIAKKWNKLLRRAGLFTFIPFVEIVFVAGSMAMGGAEEDSDFDLIVGVKTGRIFTARFFCWLVFGIFGWRKTASAGSSAIASAKAEASARADKFCFSHFAAPERYSLSGPHNEYWQDLYSHLTPIYGDKDLIQKFYDANSSWMKEKRIYQEDPRHIYIKSGWLKIFFEKALGGKFGGIIEKWLKTVQVKKIEKSLKTVKQYKPRIIFNDGELEFHPDTKRIEEMLNKR